MASEHNSGRTYTPREGAISPKARRKRARALLRSHSSYDVIKDTSPSRPSPREKSELSIDFRAPGLLKIFGESVVAGARYKSVLASTRSTAQELIKQALERYGLPSRLYRDFVLCESVGRATEPRASEDGGGNITGKITKPHSSEKTRKNGTALSQRSLSPSSLFSSSRKRSSPRTPRSARSLLSSRSKSKIDKSPCGTPRAPCDSPRTPLGSPRTPCGSPSTSRGSPRTSVCNHNKLVSNEQELLNYRPPRVYGTGRPALLTAESNRTECISRHFAAGVSAGKDSPRIINNVLKPNSNANIRYSGGCNDSNVIDEGGFEEDTERTSDWTEVSLRVLAHTDRPLELQDYWKPPEGLSRRFELRRRCDVIMNAADDDTLGLNDNARKIMMSKVSPGVIPYTEYSGESSQRRSTLKEEWDRASMLTNATLTYGSGREQILTNAVEGDTRQAYVCPSIYPYLLTLRGCSIQKDLVLYPLKSRSLSIGSAEKKSQSDDIRLCSDDVLPMHCRVTLKRLPQDGESGAPDQRLYWYCLDLDIYGSAYVTVNGTQVSLKATIYPGDLLGVGRQYLFLYKDPTGGHDIPSEVPWLPEHEVTVSLYAQVNRNRNRESHDGTGMISERHTRSDDITSHDYFELDEMNDSALRDAAIFLAYHRDKEVEVMEAISEVQCFSQGDYPHSLAVLYLAAHHYSARKFSGDHQNTFFKRMVRVIRARVGVLSKSLSQQKQESAIFGLRDKRSSQSEADFFPSMVTWLSNVMALLGHFRTSQFHSYVSSLSRRLDTSPALQEAVNSLEETVNFLFQQTVYSVTKVLYDPINSLMRSASQDDNASKSSDAIGRIVTILQATQQLAKDVLLHNDVTSQLMVYLLFFVSTTLFNRVIGKGSLLYNRDSGARLQEDISALERWANGAGLEAEFVRVSEHIMSLTDLLASSKRSLLRLDWASFQKQFSPLTDAQLCKVLAEYQLGDGAVVPPAWYPPYPVDVKQDLMLSLSSHPQFVIPDQATEINLRETFPPAFFRHLEQVQQRFSLVGEDAYYSGLSSAGNTPRLSESLNRQSNLATFFSQESVTSHTSATTNQRGVTQTQVRQMGDGRPSDTQASRGTDNGGHTLRSQMPKPPPPPPPPKPSMTSVRQSAQGHQHMSTQGGGHDQPPPVSRGQGQHVTLQDHTDSQVKHPVAPPPYSLAMKNSRMAKAHRQESHETRANERQHHPVVVQHSLPEQLLEQRSRPFQQSVPNIQPLPSFHDKTMKTKSLPNQNGDHRHHGNKPQPPLQTQHSWAHDLSRGLFQRHEHAQNFDLASSYPFARPRPSSASDYIQHLDQLSSAPNGDIHSGDQFMNSSQRDEFLRARSNSALGHQSRHSPHFGNPNPVENVFSHDSRGILSNRQPQGNQYRAPLNYEHIKDSSYRHNGDKIRVYNHDNKHEISKGDQDDERPHVSNHETDNLKRSPRSGNLSVRTSSQTNLYKPSKNRELAQCDALDQRLMNGPDGNTSDDRATQQDVPPPLPPKGKLLLRQSSVDSQKSGDNSRIRRDSGPHTSTTSSNPQRSGSRTSVEIQDITENQYIVYNPNLPVKDIFDQNQNLYKMESKNPKIRSNPSSPSSQRKMLKVPPLELPDDLLATSGTESPDEVFSDTSGRGFDVSDNSFRSQKMTESSSSKHSQDDWHPHLETAHADAVRLFNGLENINFALRSRPRSSTGSDKYPDDIYIDVEELDIDPSGSNSSLLKVLPVGDGGKTAGYDSDPGTVSVRYRHSMPEARDIATKGEITGEVFTVSLNKAGSKLGMGLIDGLHTSLKLPGIYVRNVLPDTPAALCGCIRVGDRILAVNGKSIVGADYQSAMKLIRSTGPRLNLLVAKCDRSVASKISASNA